MCMLTMADVTVDYIIHHKLVAITPMKVIPVKKRKIMQIQRNCLYNNDISSILNLKVIN